MSSSLISLLVRRLDGRKRRVVDEDKGLQELRIRNVSLNCAFSYKEKLLYKKKGLFLAESVIILSRSNYSSVNCKDCFTLVVFSIFKIQLFLKDFFQLIIDSFFIHSEILCFKILLKFFWGGKSIISVSFLDKRDYRNNFKLLKLKI